MCCAPYSIPLRLSELILADARRMTMLQLNMYEQFVLRMNSRTWRPMASTSSKYT